MPVRGWVKWLDLKDAAAHYALLGGWPHPSTDSTPAVIGLLVRRERGDELLFADGMETEGLVFPYSVSGDLAEHGPVVETGFGLVLPLSGIAPGA